MVDCFHVSGFGYSYNESTSQIHFLYFQYKYSEQEYNEKLIEVETTADNILNGIYDNNSLTDVQKALLIHDRIILQCEYDKKNLDNNTIPEESYNIYGVAVCQGYAEAYKYLLEKVGIKSHLCSSDALNHAWNIVYINNVPYHVDVTWDDPTWDVSGRVYHENFLISSGELCLTGQDAYDYNTAPNDTTYDDYFWENSNTAFQLIDGEIYYIDSADQNMKQYIDDNNSNVLCAVNDNFSRLATDGEYLYYSVSNGVYKYDLNTGLSTLVFEPSHNFGAYFNIYGFAFKNDEFICELYCEPNFDSDTKSRYTTKFQIEEVESLFDIVGSITSSEPSVDPAVPVTPVVLKLFDNNGNTVETVESADGTYTLSVSSGEYTLEVSKKDHVTRTYQIVVENGAISQDIKLHLIGDISGDSSVDSNDIEFAKNHYKNKALLSDYAFKCADVTGDGKVDILDVNRLNLYYKNKIDKF